MDDMTISKDFIKFRQFIRTKNLSVNEQFLLEFLFEYYNHDCGYSYPEIKKDIMSAFNTTSKPRVIAVIKSLEEKALIVVDRSFKNNRYYLIGVEKFITVADKSKPREKQNIDSDGNAPVEGQVTVEEVLSDELKEKLEVIKPKYTGKVNDPLKELLNKHSLSDIKRVVDNANGIMTLGFLEKGLNMKANNTEEKKPKYKNFTEREYDLDELEKQLTNHQFRDEEVAATTTSNPFFICEKCGEGNLNTREQGQICQDCGYDNK